MDAITPASSLGVALRAAFGRAQSYTQGLRSHAIDVHVNVRCMLVGVGAGCTEPEFCSRTSCVKWVPACVGVFVCPVASQDHVVWRLCVCVRVCGCVFVCAWMCVVAIEALEGCVCPRVIESKFACAVLWLECQCSSTFG